MKKCYACLKEFEIRLPVGRQDECPHCGADLHCCLNCAFYAAGAHNQCRESQAERVTEKGRSNFCDYFVFRDAAAKVREKEDQDTARSKLEALFKRDA